MEPPRAERGCYALTDAQEIPPEAGETPSAPATSKGADFQYWACYRWIICGCGLEANAGAWTLPRTGYWGKFTYFRYMTGES